MSKDLLKPSLLKIAITLLLSILIFILGVQLFNNPIFLKTGCHPNPSCPTCLSCTSWDFPEVIRFESLLLLLPIYLIAAFISQLITRKKNKTFYHHHLLL